MHGASCDSLLHVKPRYPHDVSAPVAGWQVEPSCCVGAAWSAAGVGEGSVFAGAVVLDLVRADELVADADLDGVAERLGVTTLATLNDRDFRVVRLRRTDTSRWSHGSDKAPISAPFPASSVTARRRRHTTLDR